MLPQLTHQEVNDYFDALLSANVEVDIRHHRRRFVTTNTTNAAFVAHYADRG